MELRLRPYATAGIALVGASVIAITPVAPPPTAMQVSSPAVNLSAAIDPIAPWLDVVNDSSANATALAGTFFEAPAPILQQVIVNQAAYLGQLLNNPRAIGDVLSGIGDNLQKAFQTATILGLDQETAAPLLLQSNDFLHFLVASAIPFVFEPTLGEQGAAILTEVIRFLASPASGVLIGMAGPVISPAVAALNSALELVDAVRAGSVDDALQALVAMPANVAGGFLNGATLNLDFVLPLVSLITPESFPVTGLSMAFGGLLTPGSTGGLPFPEGIGGSIVNSLGVTTVLGAPLTIEGQPVGPLGALTNLSQMIAKAIGWDGAGNPLTKLTFPTIDPAAAPLAARIAPDKIQAKSAPPSVGDIATIPTDNKATVTIDLADKPGSEVTTAGDTSEEVSGNGTTVGDPVEKTEKSTKPAHRQNPLSRLKTALAGAGDKAENTRSDIAKKLKPRKSAAKTPGADKNDSGNAA